jgi:hypothetical protein
MKSFMNIDQINGILRIVVPGICTWLAAKGFHWLGDEGVQAEAAAAVVAIAAMIWSYFTHTPENTIKRAVRLHPDMRIEVPPEIVEKHPAVKDMADDAGMLQVVHRKT